MSSLVRAVLCCFPCSLVFFTLGLSLPLSLSSLVFLLSFAFILASIFSVLYLQACSFSFSLASFFCSLSGLFVRFSLFMSSLLFWHFNCSSHVISNVLTFLLLLLFHLFYCAFLSSSLIICLFILFCSCVVLFLKALVLWNCVFLRILSVLYVSPVLFLLFFFLALSGLRSPRFPSSIHVPVSPVLSCLVRGALPSLNVRALISAWCLLLLEGLLVPC